MIVRDEGDASVGKPASLLKNQVYGLRQSGRGTANLEVGLQPVTFSSV